MSEEALTVVVIAIPVMTLISGVIIVIAGMLFKARTLEIQHRERMMMIERGLTPPPESSPTGTVNGAFPVSNSTNRARSIGVVIIGIGLAFMCLIGIAAESPQEAIGIGGAIVILGSAFIVRGMVVTPTPVSRLTQPSSPPPPFPPSEPRP